MPRNATSADSYLELHDGNYRVTVGVPKKLHGLLGKRRLKKALNTNSLKVANAKKRLHIAYFKKLISDGWVELKGQPLSDISKALAFRKRWLDAIRKGDSDIDELRLEIMLHAHSVMMLGSTMNFVFVDDEERNEMRCDDDPIFLDGALQRAETFKAIAFGRATPISLYHEEFLETLPIANRSKRDDRRALKLFFDWCHAENLNPSLENIDRQTAFRFRNKIRVFAGLDWATATKYMGRLKMYWDFLEEGDLVSRNVWAGLRIRKRHHLDDEKERAFTDDEIRTLFMGTEDVSMLDPMRIAALTGARLDVIIDLRVGECLDGVLTFQPQKRETSARDVPAAEALAELIKRRTEGKLPDDDLFPEWPYPKSENSDRERSATYSQKFTKYRRKLGIADEVDGKRRSLVNFHSFRRWFITKGEQAGISEALLAAIVGHKRPGMTLGRYSEGPLAETAREGVEKVQLPPLDDTPIPIPRSVLRKRKSGSRRGTSRTARTDPAP